MSSRQELMQLNLLPPMYLDNISKASFEGRLKVWKRRVRCFNSDENGNIPSREKALKDLSLVDKDISQEKEERKGLTKRQYTRKKKLENF